MGKSKPKNYEPILSSKLDFGDTISIQIQWYLEKYIANVSNHKRIEYSSGPIVTSNNQITMPSFKSGDTNVPKGHNCYLIFDVNHECLYVGIRDEEKLQSRLNQHLIKGNTGASGTKSAIEYVVDYYNSGHRELFIVTFEVKPHYMVKAIESWLINYYWRLTNKLLGKQQCDWNVRD
jgi:hypothetical protein